MTGNSLDYVEFVKEQLASIPRVESGRFFGGVGLSMDGVQFAMLMGNTLYFAVNDATRPSYEQLGSHCFWYKTKKGQVDVKKYYEVPGEMLEDQNRLVLLAKESIQVARKAKKVR
jgi:DNA transformation protein and related proteins